MNANNEYPLTKNLDHMDPRSRDEWERTFDSIPDLIAILDNNQHIVRANRAMAERLGRTPAQCTGQICYECVHGQDHRPEFCPHTLTIRDGKQHMAEVYEPRLGGYFLVSTNPLYDAQGKVVGVVHVARDINERKQSELALEQANMDLQHYADQLKRSNQALEDFVFIASHDMREPLRKIQAFGDLLLESRGPEGNEQSQSYIQRMQKAAGRMQSMLDGLLAYSRVTTQCQAFAEVDLGKVAAEVLLDLEVAIMRSEGRVEIGELPSLEADPLQMRQLFQNLISNALKFSKPDEKPVVKVYARAARSDGSKEPGSGPLLIGRSPAAGESISLIVEDNGIGFDMEQRKWLFKPFHRLNRSATYEGTGMGLSICRKIAERHGGQITAITDPGKGSTFFVTLPSKQKTC